MILEPPPNFLGYTGPLTEWIMPAPKVDVLCRSADKDSLAMHSGQIIGCQFWIGQHCFIVLSQHAVVPLRKHEIAHCAGYKH